MIKACVSASHNNPVLSKTNKQNKQSLLHNNSFQELYLTLFLKWAPVFLGFFSVIRISDMFLAEVAIEHILQSRYSEIWIRFLKISCEGEMIFSRRVAGWWPVTLLETFSYQGMIQVLSIISLISDYFRSSKYPFPRVLNDFFLMPISLLCS